MPNLNPCNFSVVLCRLVLKSPTILTQFGPDKQQFVPRLYYFSEATAPVKEFTLFINRHGNPVIWHTPLKFNSSPLKSYRNPIGSRIVFQPSILDNHPFFWGLWISRDYQPPRPLSRIHGSCRSKLRKKEFWQM